MDALPRLKPQDKRNRLRAVSELTASDVGIVVHEFAHGLKRMLMESLTSLRSSFAALDKKTKEFEGSNLSSASKFSIPTEMKCGAIEDFHKGLEGRIGGT